jgi:5-methylcytosine-specific restriction endonuclease McrA
MKCRTCGQQRHKSLYRLGKYTCNYCIAGKQQAARHRRFHKQTWTDPSEIGTIYPHFPYVQWGVMLERAGHTCSHCGKTGNMTIDHIIPLSKGGGYNIENLQPLCKSCNSSKLNRTNQHAHESKNQKGRVYPCIAFKETA